MFDSLWTGKESDEGSVLDMLDILSFKSAHSSKKTHDHRPLMPLLLSVVSIGIIIVKEVYYNLSFAQSVFPDSSFMLTLGVPVGIGLSYLMPNQDFRLDPNLFFWVLLPPIVLDAGYFVPNQQFFKCLKSIIVFALLGTLLNTFFTAMSIFTVQNMFDNPYGHNFTLPVVTTFSTIISAVDPVASISVFEEIHVNRHLYILVFGESLLNDAVTIVLYNTFRPFSVTNAAEMQLKDVVSCIFSFFTVSFGGIAIGFVFGCLTGLVTKLTVCGLTVKRYMTANLDDSTLVSFNYVLKTLSSSSETIIFIMLGVSVSTHKHAFNLPFIAVSLASCLIFRFCIVIGMSTLLNQFYEPKIRFVDQFVMAYGGIRGAVCYGLVVSWHKDETYEQEMFTSTALVVILVTSIFQGCSIKKIVECLKVQHAEPEKEKSLFEMLVLTAITKGFPVLSNIAGFEQQSWCERYKARVQVHLDKWLMIKSASKNSISEKLIKRSQTIMINEAISQIKQYGSYRVLPHTPFDEPTLSTSKSVPNNISETPSPVSFEKQEPYRFVVNKHLKPVIIENLGNRKESLRAIFQGAIKEPNEEMDPLYSRHFMTNVRHIPTTRRMSMGFLEKVDNTDYTELNSKTVPNGKILLQETENMPVMRRRLDSEPSRPTILPQKRIRPKFDIGTGPLNDSNSPLIQEHHVNSLPDHPHVQFERNTRVVFRTISEDNEE